MQKEASILLALLVLVTGCTSSKVSALDYSDQGGEVRISSYVSISQARDRATYAVLNDGEDDLFCPQLTARAIFDNPDTYLETGEQVDALTDVFVRGHGAVHGTFTRGGSMRSNSQIRSAVALDGGHTCSRATFVDYCRAAKKSLEEEAFMGFLFEKFNSSTCETLFQKIRGRETLDLIKASDVTSRPLIYLPMLRKVKVSQQVAASAEVKNLSSKTVSLFAISVN
ncbi:hypothetical protein EHI42_19710 [Rhizobium hidalgonense]|uniref:hypothetical protein n=1 Tax=Rhizobium hidalgonense TaxID=1538159 RepID=UPI000FEC93A0|nr:hypothetical protein [Rhizobium hidalgonense]RWX13623.1 hypothetical protein EHI42_19710 [Rhizobium hidalgonense]